MNILCLLTLLIHQLSITTGADYVASSVEDEIRPPVAAGERVAIHSSVPLNLRYSFSFTDPNIGHYLPGGYQGLGIGVLNFGSLNPGGFSKSMRNIGYPVEVYLFQGGPILHFNRRLSLEYEWNFGAAIGWKPYSAANHAFNLAVGSQVNAYLHLGLGLKWQLLDNLGLMAGLGVSHFSNGNTSFPNPGVNSFGLRLGIIYSFGRMPSQDINEITNDHSGDEPDYSGDERELRNKLQYDISMWGSTRKRVYRGGDNPVLLPGHFACAGLSFAPMVSLNKWWRVGGSLDLQYDHSAGMPKGINLPVDGSGDLNSTNELPGHPSFWHQVSAGISAHGELRMPIFAVNIGVGYNFVAPWENRGSYQNIALKTYFCSRMFLNIGYQLRNFHQQSSLMLGLGVTL
ncbi:MAG: acyloxyacyl hydrolase [Muribaculaceae bacterium]|nr:acyloxyacyl hydrolase [Muribaculaceae bacterium]